MSTIFETETVYEKAFRDGRAYMEKCSHKTATFSDHFDDLLNRLFSRFNPDVYTIGYQDGKQSYCP